MTAAVPLYRYQQRWLEDQSDLKGGLWCRSSGKTFIETLEIVLDCKRHDVLKTRVPWFLFSGAEGQTLEMIQYATLHAKALEMAFEEQEEFEYIEGIKFTMKSVVFEHGSRIVGLPTNKLSIRGKHGNLWWDEAGSTPHDEDIWGAAAPIAGRKGFKMRLTGTPGPKRGPFFHVMSGVIPGWSRHVINIHQAIADGAPLDLEKIKSMYPGGVRSPKFITEYLVLFEDDGVRLIPLELICACEDEGTLEVPFLRIDEQRKREWEPHLDRNPHEDAPSDGYDDPAAWRRLFAPLAKGRRQLFVGYDVARSGHLSVIWVTELDGLLRRTRAVIAFHKRRWKEQEACLFALLEHANRACIDSTGNGGPIAEKALEAFGEHVVEPVNFNGPVKEDLAARMLRVYEDRLSRIPPAIAIRDSIHAVYKTTTAAGHTRYDADATEEAGHADFFWAQGLSLMAAGDGASEIPRIQSMNPRRWNRRSGVIA